VIQPVETEVDIPSRLSLSQNSVWYYIRDFWKPLLNRRLFHEVCYALNFELAVKQDFQFNFFVNRVFLKSFWPFRLAPRTNWCWNRPQIHYDTFSRMVKRYRQKKFHWTKLAVVLDTVIRCWMGMHERCKILKNFTCTGLLNFCFLVKNGQFGQFWVKNGRFFIFNCVLKEKEGRENHQLFKKT